MHYSIIRVWFLLSGFWAADSCWFVRVLVLTVVSLVSSTVVNCCKRSPNNWGRPINGCKLQLKFLLGFKRLYAPPKKTLWVFFSKKKLVRDLNGCKRLVRGLNCLTWLVCLSLLSLCWAYLTSEFVSAASFDCTLGTPEVSTQRLCESNPLSQSISSTTPT